LAAQDTELNGRSSIRIGIYLMMYGFGFTLTMIAPMLPRMIEEYALTLEQGSAFMTFMNAGGVLGVVLTGILGDRMRKNLLFFIGYAVLFLGMFAAGSAHIFGLLLALFFVMGASSRVVDTISNALITENYRTGAGRYLNMMHMSISLGSLSGPVTLRALMDLNISWQNTFHFLGSFCLILFLIGLFLVRGVAHTQHGYSKPEKGKPIWLNPTVIIAGLLILFYTGHQIILNVWSSMFMEEVFALSPLAASLSTTLFWLGIAISRLIGSRALTNNNARTLIRWGALLGGLALAVAVLSRNPMLTMAGFALSGLLSGATIPILIHLVTHTYPGRASQVTSTLYLFSISSSIAFPWLCGRVADSWGFRAGFLISAASLFCVTILTFALPAAASD